MNVLLILSLSVLATYVVGIAWLLMRTPPWDRRNIE